MLDQSNANHRQPQASAWSALAFSLICVLVGGCSSHGADVSLADISTTEPRDCIETTKDDDSTLTLEHDFGVVRPAETHEHAFALENRSDRPWNIARVHVNCRCTVTSASARSIAPGGTEYLNVTYTAGKAASDDSRTIEVAFAEESAPRVTLLV
jgi:hypothetical protein